MAYELIQWEYRLYNAAQDNYDLEKLNKLGEEGWETSVQYSSRSVILKRPKQPQQQPSRPSFVDRYYGR